MSSNVSGNSHLPTIDTTITTSTTAPSTDSGQLITTHTGFSSESTLSESELAVAEQLFIASLPSPPPPSHTDSTSSGSDSHRIGATVLPTTNPELFLMALAEKYHESVKAILDNMSKTVEEEKLRIKEKLKSDQYNTWLQAQSSQYIEQMKIKTPDNIELAIVTSQPYQEFLNSLPPTQRVEQIDNTNSYKEISKTELGLKTLDASGLSSFLTPASIVVGSTFTGQVFTASQAPNIIEPSQAAFQDMMHHVTATLPQETINLGALGLIGGMFTSQLTYMSWAQTGNIGKSDEAAKGETFAKNYAKNTLILMTNPVFNEKLEKAFGKEGAAMFKTIMLSMAAALVYKKEIGDWKVSAQEFKEGMLGGEMKFPKGDIRHELIANIKQQLQILPPKVREQLIDAIAKYLEKDPKVEDMEKPMKAVRGVLAEVNKGDIQG